MALGLGNTISRYTFPLSTEVNHSLSFDGTNDEVDFTTSGFQTALNASNANFKVSGSVSVWARLNTTGSNGQLWDFKIDSNNRINIQYKHNVTHKYVLTFRGGGAQKTAESASGLTHEGDGNFHHIVCTWDKGEANEMKVYVDGSLADTVSLGTVEIAGDFDDTADNVVGQADGSGGVEFLSGTSFNGNADFNGFLDDFAIFSNVLNLTKVQGLYNSGTSSPNNVSSAGTLIAHWKFNEGTGVTTTDSVAGYVGTFGGSGKNPAFSTENAAGE